MPSSFKKTGAPKPAPVEKAVTSGDVPPAPRADLAKGMNPVGSQIRGQSWNADQGEPVGGWDDHGAKRSHSMAGTAHPGEGGHPDMGPPGGPYPGQSGKAPAVDHTPTPKLGDMRTPGRASAEGVGSSMSSLARSGGKMPGVKAHKPASLPEPTATYPAQTPGGSPVQNQPTSGSMSGVMQGRRGINPGQSSMTSA